MKRLLILLIFTLSFISCSKKSYSQIKMEKNLPDTPYDESAYSDSFIVNTNSLSETWKGNGYNPEGPSGIEGTNPPVYSDMSNVIGNNEESLESPEPNIIERKLIRNGYLSVQVSSLNEAALAVEKWVSQYNGYIAESYQNEPMYTYTVRIPSNVFDQAMNSFSDVGKIQSRSVSAEDVTDRYYDLKSRLETKKLLRDKYNQYLKKAESVKDLMEIERNLNDVISEIESMEGRLRLLTNQIDYSTITISLVTASPSYSPSYSVNTIDFKRVGYNIVNFFIQLFKIIIYIIVYGIPILAIILLLYWLCFGRIGLIKKAFYKLTKKTEKKDKE